jgi:hypothetical protein
MLRLCLFIALLATFTPLVGCRRDPQPMTPKEGELPPLPPASGTAVGYLVDNAGQLSLRDDQLTRLKQIDASLAARNDSLDTQLRAMERPNEAAPAEKGAPPPRHNNAPGAQITTTGDASKLHQAKAGNNFEALEKALAVLDPDQQAIARRLLEERGIAVPGEAKPGEAKPGEAKPGEAKPGEAKQPAVRSEAAGVPLEP